MALVRVYCGLAPMGLTDRPAATGPALVAAVVDDAGRLLDVCEITDDPAGYAQLSTVLVERCGGLSGATFGSDSDARKVTALLNAAGRPLAIADADAIEEFAERFTDDESPDEVESPPAERQAIGLARALQAGAIAAVTLPVPHDLANYRSVLTAHAAMLNGRHAAATALREVLREFYPAALRAYPDPADPLALAVLDALPEPGLLTGTARGRDVRSTDDVAARLVADEIADPEAVANAITALRVAASETPRRPANKAIAAVTADTVREAVSAARAYDAGCAALVTTLVTRAQVPTSPTAARRAIRRQTGAVGAKDAKRPVSAPPAAGPPRGAADTVAIRQGHQEPAQPVPAAAPEQPTVAAAPEQPTAPEQPRVAAALKQPTVAAALEQPTVTAPAAARPEDAPTPPTGPADDGGKVQGPPTYEPRQPAERPMSAPPQSPSTAPPVPGQRKPAPVDVGEPFRPVLTTAAINSARAERRAAAAFVPRQKTPREAAESTGSRVTDFSVPVPTPRPTAEQTGPGSRANWPLVNSSDERARIPEGHDEARGFSQDTDAEPDVAPGRDPRGGPGMAVKPVTPAEQPAEDARITPPWLADDMPQEPPMLRLVEPQPLPQRPLDDEPGPRSRSGDDRPGGLSLRLIESDDDRRLGTSAHPTLPPAERAVPPVPDEPDGDLLIFAAIRSAWFVKQPDESELEWASLADSGWQAAEQAAQPATGEQTTAGLPKRVPQANLVPGSALRDERPLRVVRDAAKIAANTTGYFQGWRRGQEIGGYAVGGRPGRQAAGGWDFSRDHGDQDDSREYEYRSAGY